MTDDILKPALVLKVLQNKVLLSDSPQINVLLREFLDAAEKGNFTLGEVITLLNRFQKRKLIKVTDIFTTRQAVAMIDLTASLAGSLMHENYNYNELEENQYSERSGFGCAVNPDLYGYIEKFLADNSDAATILTLNPKLQKLLSPTAATLKLDIVLQDKFVWHCPIDRSFVGEITSKADLERYLNDFSAGKYPGCKDRRHKNRFWVDGNTITFGTLPLLLSEVFAAEKETGHDAKTKA